MYASMIKRIILLGNIDDCQDYFYVWWSYITIKEQNINKELS